MSDVAEENTEYLTQQEQIAKKLSKTQQEIEKTYKNQNTLVSKMKQSMIDIADEAKRVSTVFVSWNILENLSNHLKGMVETGNILHRTMVNAGKSAEDIAKIKNSVADLRINFGATAEESNKVGEILSKFQYAGNIDDAAEASYQLARGMGLGVEETTRLTVQLEKEGNVSASTARAMYADVMKVAQAHGLTAEGAKSVIEQTVKLSANMRLFGKTDQEIQKMNSSLASMVSAMEKVGISAQEATSWIDKMLDPSKIEENIKAYSALGVSITDALTGDIDQSTLQDGLKEFGEKVKNMGAIAGKAYAEAMGIDFGMAIKAADMSGAIEETLTPEETASNALKESVDNTKTAVEKLGDIFNSMEGRIQKLGVGFATIAVIVGNAIGKVLSNALADAGEKFKSSFEKTVDETSKESGDILSNGISDGFVKSLNQSSNYSDKKFKEIANKANDILNQGIKIHSLEKSLDEANKHGYFTKAERLKDELKKQREIYLQMNEDAKVRAANGRIGMKNEKEILEVLKEKKKEIYNSIEATKTSLQLNEKERDDLEHKIASLRTTVKIMQTNNNLSKKELEHLAESRKELGKSEDALEKNISEAKKLDNAFANQNVQLHSVNDYINTMGKSLDKISKEKKIKVEATLDADNLQKVAIIEGRTMGESFAYGASKIAKSVTNIGNRFANNVTSKISKMKTGLNDWLEGSVSPVAKLINTGKGFLTGVKTVLEEINKKKDKDGKSGKGESSEGEKKGGLLGKTAKFLGIFSLIAGFLGSLLRKSPKIQKMMEKVSKTFESVLMPVLDIFADAFEELLPTIAQTLTDLSPLLQILAKVVLFAVNLLLVPIKFVASLLSGLSKLLGKIFHIETKLAKSVDDNTEATTELNKPKAEQLSVKNDTLMVAKGFTGADQQTSAIGNNSSTSFVSNEDSVSKRMNNAVRPAEKAENNSNAELEQLRLETSELKKTTLNIYEMEKKRIEREEEENKKKLKNEAKEADSMKDLMKDIYNTLNSWSRTTKYNPGFGN